MILGQALDLATPVSLTGIVDVYDSYGRRIARKWPTRQHRGFSAEQLAHQACFRKSIIWRKNLPGWYIKWWKSVNPPPGYSYDDCLRRLFWRFLGKKPTHCSLPDMPPAQNFVFYRVLNGPDAPCPDCLALCMVYNWITHPGRRQFALYRPYYRPTTPIKYHPYDWYIREYRCSPGKKKVPHYDITVTGNWTAPTGPIMEDGRYPGHVFYYLGPTTPAPYVFSGFQLDHKYDSVLYFQTSPQCYNAHWPIIDWLDAHEPGWPPAGSPGILKPPLCG